MTNQHFYQTHHLFSRNKQYFDAEKAIKQETMYEQRRRTPQTQFHNQKFNQSFLNSTDVLTDKLQKDITKFRTRMSLSKTQDFFSSNLDASPRNKIKGVPMSLGLSRKDIITIPKDPADQRLFNNFKLQNPQLSHTPDLAKLSPRNLDFTLPHINDLMFQCSKQYEEAYYKRTTFNCRFDYKNQKLQKQRVWRPIKRVEDISELEPKVQKIQQAIKNNYKSSQISHFYNNSGKQLPPQLLMKNMKANQNYWVDDKTGKYIRPKLDFSLSMMKDALLERKKSTIKKRSEAPQKKQVCSEYYYKRVK